MKVIDATNLKVGRIGTVVAKAALLGEEVVVIHCEKAILTGSPDYTFQKYQRMYERGRPTKGPFQPRMPDRFVRKILRGMLPYKTKRGIEAFRRIKCYIGNPHDHKAETIEAASIEHSPTTKFMTVGALCQRLGGKSF